MGYVISIANIAVVSARVPVPVSRKARGHPGRHSPFGLFTSSRELCSGCCQLGDRRRIQAEAATANRKVKDGHGTDQCRTPIARLKAVRAGVGPARATTGSSKTPALSAHRRQNIAPNNFREPAMTQRLIPQSTPPVPSRLGSVGRIVLACGALLLVLRGVTYPLATVWDQGQQCDGPPSLPSQEFGNTFALAADDFEVPEGSTWIVDAIAVGGRYFLNCGSSVGGPADEVRFRIYEDAGGRPGPQVSGGRITDPWAGLADPNFTFTPDHGLTLGQAPITLGPGRYWLVVDGLQNCPAVGSWGWRSYVGPQRLSPGLWHNDGNYPTDCIVPDWLAPTTIPCLSDHPYDDRCFQIASRCGDDTLDPGEECDDGNQVNGDGCDGNCKTTRCGNEVVSDGEQCDDGMSNGTGGLCRADCTLAQLPSGLHARIVKRGLALGVVNGLALRGNDELFATLGAGDTSTVYRFDLSTDPPGAVELRGFDTSTPQGMLVGDGRPPIGNQLVFADGNQNWGGGCCDGEVVRIDVDACLANSGLCPAEAIHLFLSPIYTNANPIGLVLGPGAGTNFPSAFYVVDEFGDGHGNLWRIEADESGGLLFSGWGTNQNPTAAAAGSGGGFGTDLYIADPAFKGGTPQVWRLAGPSGPLTTFASGGSVGVPLALGFGHGGSFPADLYVLNSQGTILSVNASGLATPFISGLRHSSSNRASMVFRGTTSLLVGMDDAIIEIFKSICGDGIIDPDESCDDGDLSPGDGCSSTCRVEAAYACSGEPSVCTPIPCAMDGDLCDDMNPCTGPDTCSGGVCNGATEPQPDCGAALKSQLKWATNSGDPSKDKMKFKWTGGPLTQSQFADPTASDGYALCVYDGNALVTQLDVPAGGTCDDKNCWSIVGDKGYKFKDKNGTNDGVRAITLKGSSEPKAQISWQGKGSNLPDPTFGGPEPLTVQVHKSGGGMCTQSVFSGLQIKQNDGGGFSAKAP